MSQPFPYRPGLLAPPDERPSLLAAAPGSSKREKQFKGLENGMTNSGGGCRMRLLRISSFCRGKLRRISNPTSTDIFLQFIFGLLGRKKNIPSKVLSHINVGLLMDAYLTFPETSSSSSSRKFKTKTKNLLNSCTIVLFVCSQPTLYNCTR